MPPCFFHLESQGRTIGPPFPGLGRTVQKKTNTINEHEFDAFHYRQSLLKTKNVYVTRYTLRVTILLAHTKKCDLSCNDHPKLADREFHGKLAIHRFWRENPRG